MPSRRELITGTLVVPLAACTPAPAFAAAWDEAMRTFEKARTAEVAYDDTVWKPAFEAFEKGGPDIPDQIDDKINRLIDIRCDAEEALIYTPAPTLATVIWKIEYARERWAESSDWPDDWWLAVMNDLRSFERRV